MDRDLTRDELQRCIDKANEFVGEEPAEDDAVIALECLTNPREDDSAWAYIVTTEAARILASDVDAREAEIARLKERLAMATQFQIGNIRIKRYGNLAQWFVTDPTADPDGDRCNIDPATGKWAPFTMAAFPSMDAAFAALDAARGGK